MHICAFHSILNIKTHFFFGTVSESGTGPLDSGGPVPDPRASSMRNVPGPVVCETTTDKSRDTGPYLHICSYPHAFLKKRRGYCNRLRPSVTLSPPKPLDEIQPNLVCELLT